MQVDKLKLEFVFVFFPTLYLKKGGGGGEGKAYLPTHPKKCGSTTANKEFFTLGPILHIRVNN
jgi:hypothetical protein